MLFNLIHCAEACRLAQTGSKCSSINLLRSMSPDRLAAPAGGFVHDFGTMSSPCLASTMKCCLPSLVQTPTMTTPTMIYGAAADHNGHDDDDNARHDDGDDDDSRSRPRSNSPCDRPTPTHYSDKSWTVSPQWSSNFEHKTHKTEYSDRRLQVGDDYTARLEDRLYVDLQLFLYLHSSHISHIYNISTFCR